MNDFTWISRGTDTPFYARKEIEIENKPVKSALVDVCGLGQFVFYVNGQRIGDHELDPGWTNYNKTIEYLTFDIKENIVSGKNVLAAEIGNGWFILDDSVGYSFKFPGFMPPNPNPYKPFAKSLVLGLRLNVEYEDGTKALFETDSTWKVAEHEVRHSNVYGSAVVDSSYAIRNFACVGPDEGKWEGAIVVPKCDMPGGELVPQIHPPIKVIKTYPGRKIYDSADMDIYDFEQNMSFILEFDVKGTPGDEIKIYPSEKLDENGMVDQMAKGWMEIDTVITYKIGSDSPEHFREKFSYLAGRYIAVKKSSPDIEISGVKAGAITSAWKESGSFWCDDDRYNRIYDLVEKAVEANMVSVHTDCPTIERFAWQEPNHLMGAAIMYMKDGDKLWRKFFRDMRDAQHGAEDMFKDFGGNDIKPGDGLVPSQAPCYIPNVVPVPGMGSFYDIIAWGSSIILGVRWHYLFYGDVSVIEENYDAGMRYLAHLKSKVNDDGFINHGLGDWGNPDGDFARENIETAFLYADAVTLAWFAEVLHKTDDAKELTEYAGSVRDNYNARLLVKDDEGKFCYRSYEKKDDGIVTTQAIEALPLYWGMVPDEAVSDVAECLRKNIQERGALIAGEVGLPYIIQVAAKHGMNDLIADCITKPEHPSYYAFVLDEETTLGEYWETNPRSHCHDMMGHITEWFYNGIGGIEILEPGFKAIALHPHMPESVNELRVSYNSPYGEIVVSGKRHDGTAEYTYQVPDEVKVIGN